MIVVSRCQNLPNMLGFLRTHTLWVSRRHVRLSRRCM